MNFWRNAKRLLFVFLLSTGVAVANVPEPDHTLFGKVTAGQQTLTSGLMTLVLDGDVEPIASYQLGSSQILGNFFALPVPMALNLPATGEAAQAGQSGMLFINGQAAIRVTIGEAGDVQRLDFSTDQNMKIPGISIADAVAPESAAGPQGFDLNLSLYLGFGIDQAVMVDWQTMDGTALAGADYLAQSGKVTIPACTTIPNCPTTANITVTIYDDAIVEGDPGNGSAGEYFHIQLSSPVNAKLLDDLATVIILDDDDTPPALSINNMAVLRPGQGSVEAAFTVKLSHVWDQDISVDLLAVEDSADSSDFKLNANQLVIPAGVLSSKVGLEVFADNLAEEIEIFRVQLKNASTNSIADDEGTGRIYLGERVLYFGESHFDDEQFIEDMGGAIDIVESPDGKHVYVAANSDDALVVFNRNKQSGELSYRTSYRDGFDGLKNLEGLRSLSFSADGKFLYAAALEGLSVFLRDPGSGELTLLEVEESGEVDTQSGLLVEGLSGASAVAAFPAQGSVGGSGEHVYVAAFDDNAISIFARNPSNGLLTYKEMVADTGCNDGPGTIGLCGVSSMILSDDGNQLYATSRSDGTLTVFDRNPATGALSKNKTHSGIAGATAVAISPDGISLYVAAQAEGKVVIFDRNNNGGLTYRDRISADNNMLAQTTDVAVSRDGDYVYATGSLDDTLVVFDRAPDGSLSFHEVEKEGQLSVTGLNGASSLSVSSDDRHVYTTGYLDGATDLFRRDLEAGDGGDVIFSDGFEPAIPEGQ